MNLVVCPARHGEERSDEANQWLRVAAHRAFGRTPVSRRALRGEGPDGLDPKRLKGSPDLGRTAAVDLAGLGRAEIMRTAVAVEAHRQAVVGKHVFERPESRGRALLLDEKRRIDRPRRVVEGGPRT